MNQIHLTKHSEKQTDFRSIILIGSGIAFIAAGLLSIRSKNTPFIPPITPPRLPPIIIKSGSFTLETYDRFLPDVPESSLNDELVYRGTLDDKILGGVVLPYDELQPVLTIPKEFIPCNETLAVRIWFEDSSSTTPNVTINAHYDRRTGKTTFQLNLLRFSPLYLTEKHSAKRKFQYQDNEERLIQFRLVTVQADANRPREFHENDINVPDYIIAFYFDQVNPIN